MKILKEKAGKLGPGMIKATIVALVFLVVLVNMLPSLIHTSAESVQTLATEYSNETIYGAGPSAIGSQLGTWTGYFWVIGPFVLILGVISYVFMRRR